MHAAWCQLQQQQQQETASTGNKHRVFGMRYNVSECIFFPLSIFFLFRFGLVTRCDFYRHYEILTTQMRNTPPHVAYKRNGYGVKNTNRAERILYMYTCMCVRAQWASEVCKMLRNELAP